MIEKDEDLDSKEVLLKRIKELEIELEFYKGVAESLGYPVSNTKVESVSVDTTINDLFKH